MVLVEQTHLSGTGPALTASAAGHTVPGRSALVHCDAPREDAVVVDRVKLTAWAADDQLVRHRQFGQQQCFRVLQPPAQAALSCVVRGLCPTLHIGHQVAVGSTTVRSGKYLR